MQQIRKKVISKLREKSVTDGRTEFNSLDPPAESGDQ